MTGCPPPTEEEVDVPEEIDPPADVPDQATKPLTKPRIPHKQPKDTAVSLPDEAVFRIKSSSVTDSSKLLLIWLDISDLEYTRAALRDSMSAWIADQQASGGGYMLFYADGQSPLMATQSGGAEPIFMALTREFPEVPYADRVAAQTLKAWKAALAAPAWQMLEVKFVISANLYNISRAEFLFPIHEILFKEGRPMHWTLYAETVLKPDSSIMDSLGLTFSYLQLKPSSEL